MDPLVSLVFCEPVGRAATVFVCAGPYLRLQRFILGRPVVLLFLAKNRFLSLGRLRTRLSLRPPRLRSHDSPERIGAPDE